MPGWCKKPEVTMNKKMLELYGPGSYVEINRQWSNGDKLKLRLPMKVTLRKWTKNKDSVSVDRGPLTYSLKIGEKYVRAGGTDEWPAWEIHPTTAWNYGLVLNESDLASSFKVKHKAWPTDNQPFEATAAPIELRAKAREIPAWQMDRLGLVGQLQQSPAKSNEPTETVTLIPMGCARLRISAFPTIGSGPDAHEWKAPPKTLPATASHCWDADTVVALSDGRIPHNSNDHSIPRFTWWDHKGTAEWVQYDFDKPTNVSRSAVYFFDDTGQGSCRLPKSWRLLWKAGGQWKEVSTADSYGLEKDTFNRVRFDPVETTALRLEAQLQPNSSAGILEWQIDANRG
ncbi:MAG: glycoside hydrolase family 127 protein [Sedimentisphaerales bacterium]